MTVDKVDKTCTVSLVRVLLPYLCTAPVRRCTFSVTMARTLSQLMRVYLGRRMRTAGTKMSPLVNTLQKTDNIKAL